MERAADWIFSHADELDLPEPMESEETTPQASKAPRDGPPSKLSC